MAMQNKSALDSGCFHNTASCMHACTHNIPEATKILTFLKSKYPQSTPFFSVHDWLPGKNEAVMHVSATQRIHTTPARRKVTSYCYERKSSRKGGSAL